MFLSYFDAIWVFCCIPWVINDWKVVWLHGHISDRHTHSGRGRITKINVLNRSPKIYLCFSYKNACTIVGQDSCLSYQKLNSTSINVKILLKISWPPSKFQKSLVQDWIWKSIYLAGFKNPGLKWKFTTQGFERVFGFYIPIWFY